MQIYSIVFFYGNISHALALRTCERSSPLSVRTRWHFIAQGRICNSHHPMCDALSNRSPKAICWNRYWIIYCFHVTCNVLRSTLMSWQLNLELRFIINLLFTGETRHSSGKCCPIMYTKRNIAYIFPKPLG